MIHRNVFKTLSNIHDGAFFEIVNCFNLVTVFTKFHLRCLTGLLIRFSFEKNLQVFSVGKKFPVGVFWSVTYNQVIRKLEDLSLLTRMTKNKVDSNSGSGVIYKAKKWHKILPKHWHRVRPHPIQDMLKIYVGTNKNKTFGPRYRMSWNTN